MSLDHWIDHLTDAESRELDEIELAIMSRKEEIQLLRKKQRRLLDIGTNRKRRSVK